MFTTSKWALLLSLNENDNNIAIIWYQPQKLGKYWYLQKKITLDNP